MVMQESSVLSGKPALRAHVRMHRTRLGADKRRLLSQQICEHLVLYLASLPGPVALYHPHGGEVDCLPAMRLLHDGGVKIAIPRVIAKAAPLAFQRWQPEAVLVNNRYGIAEMAEEAEYLVPQTMVLPMLGFTQEGYRLGYGGGYYDRTLAALAPACPALHTAGIAFTMQELLGFVPDAHDMPLDAMITERGIHLINS